MRHSNGKIITVPFYALVVTLDWGDIKNIEFLDLGEICEESKQKIDVLKSS